jgi:hypothetical protein
VGPGSCRTLSPETTTTCTQTRIVAVVMVSRSDTYCSRARC